MAVTGMNAIGMAVIGMDRTAQLREGLPDGNGSHVPAAPIAVDDLKSEPDHDQDKYYVARFESHEDRLPSMTDGRRIGKY
jgi:hypothetical protein